LSVKPKQQLTGDAEDDEIDEIFIDLRGNLKHKNGDEDS
jgi:hypothetical protein